MFGPGERGREDPTREIEGQEDREKRITDFDAGRRQREARRITAAAMAAGWQTPDVVQALCAAQQRAGLTTAELATRLGVTRNTVSVIRNGRMRATLLLAIRWLGACGWDLMAVER